MGSCHSNTDTQHNGEETNMEMNPSKPSFIPATESNGEFREMWGSIAPFKEQIAQELYSRVFGDRRYSFIATHSRFGSARSLSSNSSSLSSTTTCSMMSTSSSSSTPMRQTLKKDSDVVRFVKIVCLILECPMDKALLQLCILGEIYGGFSVFLDAFVAALKTVLIISQTRFTEECIEQFLFFVGDMVELLRDDVTLRSGTKDSAFSDEQMECTETNEADLDMFYDFWQEKIVKRDVEGRLARRVSRKLLESSSQLRNLFPTRTDLQTKIIDHLVTVFSDSSCEHLSSIYDNIINCQKLLTVRHFSQFGQAFILSLKDELGSEFTADHVARFRKLYRVFLIPILIGFQHTTLQKRTKRRDGQRPRKCPKASALAQLKARHTAASNSLLTAPSMLK